MKSRLIHPATRFLLLLVVTLALSPAGHAVEAYTYDHLSENKSVFKNLRVAEGAYFKVLIDKTCDAFETNWTAIPLAQEPPGAAVTFSANDTISPHEFFKDKIDCELAKKPRELVIPHSSVNGGYVVRIINSKTPGSSAVAISVADGKDAETVFNEKFKDKFGSDDKLASDYEKIKLDDVIRKLDVLHKLNEVTVTIGIDKVGWDYEFAGGVTISELTDPRFTTEMRTVDGTEKMFAIRNPAAEDDYNPGFGTFVHLTHSKFEKWSPVSFGLGLNDESNANIFIGTSWRLGGKGFVTLGYNFGKVDRLPTGTILDAEIADANVLNDLPTRTDGAVFLGLSFSFLGKGLESLQKPFLDPKPTVVTDGGGADEDGDSGDGGDGGDGGDNVAPVAGAAIFSESDRVTSRQYSVENTALLRILDEWIAAWQNQDVPAYLDAYSKDFRSQKGTYDQWIAARAKALRSPSYIRIGYSILGIENKGDAKEVTFRQEYRSNLYNGIDTERRVVFEKDRSGRWKIIRESNR